MKTRLPEIPAVSEVLRPALSSLVRSAALFRKAFLSLAEGNPLGEVLEGAGPSLEIGDQVIDHWADRMGIRSDL
jgi:hypothetical protein